MKIKTYIAGKVAPDSVFGTYDWRDSFCRELSEKSGFEIVNLDPTKSENFELDQNNPRLIFGRCCFMINSADLVIAHLTDDISVGGSQEMLISKHYKKPLIGLAPKNGKFNKDEKELMGKTYKNYIDPFVSTVCDRIVENINELSEVMKIFFSNMEKVKDISILDENLKYYKTGYYKSDKFLQKIHEKI